MVYERIILYMVIMVTALVVGVIFFKTVNSRNILIKAALFHYFMNYSNTVNQRRLKDVSLPSTAYTLAIRKFRKMNEGSDDSNFCFEVFKHQVKTFGGRSAMLQAARRRHFPK